MAQRIQRPTTEDNWLYQDQEEGRYFCKIVYLGVNAEEWQECTNEEKVAWEEAHPQPESAE